ncbi:hypothetical protein [Streptomyces sp. NBC_00829]|uniref:hypothetical protein n=1 Tax=Streptomyces sp. NBC_00829 TaxID=2903679 RepID=UPI0038695FEB|nr:hypothetical protein OG293_00330 [Streptomyces sp. NBC_00829]WTB19051.1 hypothetical protein OG293_39205 [Streptomyces sp. NBC_00829]
MEVAELAAEHFDGREAELAEMTVFCTAPDAQGSSTAGTGYWRWLAPAWSGKTALMAQFALHPPQGVDVLAFFITSRAAGRSDRTAFLSALQGQLREYLHEGDVDCVSKGQFLNALKCAATQAAAAGRRLVLLVDGLDEDTGVESASSGYSIASLLPRDPPAGMRIMVAGRTNPPVPSDVHESHALYSRHIDHVLAVSEAARVVRQAAERDLQTLLAGGWEGREVARLVAAADGGLSIQDLADLLNQANSEMSPRDVRETLGGHIGRSFQLRSAQWPGSEESPTHLIFFAHEELRKATLKSMSPQVLDAYRERIHAFVEHWRASEWPVSTPEYVLIGYPHLLRDLKDTERLTGLATDALRHERLWLITGADTQALAEITDAFRLQSASAAPDLTACVRLAYGRHCLRRKAANVPHELIITWAQLGQVRRAFALAPCPNPSRADRHLTISSGSSSTWPGPTPTSPLSQGPLPARLPIPSSGIKP